MLVYFLINALTFWTDSLAISPSLPVAMIFPPSFDWAGAASAAIGETIPLLSPITASPFTRPTLPPSGWTILYSFLCLMDLSAICCSNVLENFLASITCSAVTKSAPFSIATSPDDLTSPPKSLNLRVKASCFPERRFASKIISSNASGAKWGILPSFLTSWATNLTNFFLFSGVSSIESFMKTS